ncbi:hypothetical protein IAU60_000680 [Kwoniella sp. DSM 27419]
MSSPCVPPSFGEIFDTVHGTPHILSSPVHSAFPAFDPSSPFNSIRKTPNDRGLRRTRTTEGFLISPMASSQAQASFHALHSSHVFGLPDRTRTPTLGFRTVAVAETPVQIADPDVQPSWDGMNFSDLNQDGLDISSYEQGIQYGSPMKVRQSQEATTPVMIPMPDPTKMLSPTAPGSARKVRTLSGLGTPSGAHRPAKRIRQATYDANSMPLSPSASRRRTVDQPPSLTTSRPLSRAVSTSSVFLGPGQPYQDRNVSTSSGMTASTSYEVMSPNMTAFPDVYRHMPVSASLPELMPSHSQVPSPTLPGGGSPICTPQQPAGVFYHSPDADQGNFGMGSDVQGDMTLMSQVTSVMPQSTSLASVASFPGSVYRANTLTTIVETPLLAQEGMTFSAPSSSQFPSQPSLPPQPQFNQVDYPHVPGLSLNYQPGLPTTTQPVDIQAWSAQTYSAQPPVFHFQSAPPPIPGPSMPPQQPQRHVSTSFLNYQMRSNDVPVFPNVPRSVSAPFVHTMQSVPPAPPQPVPMTQSLSQGGLFGPMPTSLGPNEPMSDGTGQSWNQSTPVSPETPRKRQIFPPVGKRLKPGPKPKPKTPKKAKGSSSPEELFAVDPSMIAGPSNPVTMHMPVIDEDDGPTSETSPKPSQALVFGPDLTSMSAMQRSMSTEGLLPQQLPGQPQLVIQPPRTSVAALNIDAAAQAAGLPRAFLEKLYTTFLTLDGSMTGQPVKRFKCLIEGCERHFPRKSAIHSHIQTHLEDKPFVCTAEDCHAAFVRQHDLRRHTRIHSGTKPFPCPCGKGFARGDALMRHRQRGICSGSLVPRRDEA